MSQVARNLTDCDDGFLKEARYLIHDRDPLFMRSFREILKSSGIETLKLPARSANLNAYAERFVRSIKFECLAQIIPLGEDHLRHVVKAYTERYHADRNHQGLDFLTQQTGIACGDTQASLFGRTFDRQSISGSDAINTFNCPRVRKRH
jgi:hypothetical protein